MRILIATDTYPPDLSGSSIFCHRLARDLARDGLEVHVVCVSDSGPGKLDVTDGVRIHRLPSLPLLVYPNLRFTDPLAVRRRLRDLFAAVRPNVLHAQDHFTIGRASIRIAVEQGIPIVATNHFMPQNLTPYVPAPLRSLMIRVGWADLRRVYRRADRLTAPTPTAAAMVARHGLSAPVEPISCGVSVDRFHPCPSPSRSRRTLGLPDRPTIGYVGRLDVEKHLEEPLRAVARLPHTQLVLTGSGTQRDRLQALAVELGVADRVHFLGFVPDETLPQVYAACDVFCLPGIAELESIATLEALASGLPVVLADAVALPHLVREGTNGYLYPPGDIDALTDALRRVLESDRGAMGAASRQIAEEHASARTVERFAEIYRDLARATAPE